MPGRRTGLECSLLGARGHHQKNNNNGEMHCNNLGLVLGLGLVRVSLGLGLELVLRLGLVLWLGFPPAPPASVSFTGLLRRYINAVLLLLLLLLLEQAGW